MKTTNHVKPVKDRLKHLSLAGSTARIASSLAALALATTSARSQVILGGDFQLYQPASSTVTATITTGWGVIWSVASPTNMAVGGTGGLLTCSDSTTGTTADLLQWTKTRGGANILPNGPSGSLALNAFATWGGHTQVETTGSLHTVAAGQTIRQLQSEPMADLSRSLIESSTIMTSPITRLFSSCASSTKL